MSSSSELFHVARGETPVGRFSVDEILARVEKGELDPLDHVYDEGKSDWIAISFHPSFSQHTEFWTRLGAAKKSAELSVAAGSKSSNEAASNQQEEWFVLKGDHRFGPYEYLELIRLTQEKSLNDWDFVWTKRFPKWVRIATLNEFKPQTIQSLRETLSERLGGTVNEIFFRRRYARASFEGSILVHNNQKLFKGKSLEMGAGGISLILQDGDLSVGDKVHVHIKPSKDTPAFNSSCEVMSRRALSAGDSSSQVVFGIKFLAIDQRVKSQIDRWANGKVNEQHDSSKKEAA
jgi:hypothetical protein